MPTSFADLDPDKIYALLNSEAQGHVPDEVKPYIAAARKRGLIPPPLPTIPQPQNVVNAITGTEEDPSVGGFAKNVLTSGGQFVADTAKGLWGLGEGAVSAAMGAAHAIKDPIAAVQAAPGVIAKAPQAIKTVGKALGKGISDSYGSPTDVLHTAYTDPVGMAADISTVATGGELAAGKLGAEGLARGLGKVAAITDPMSILRIPKAPGQAEKVMTKALNPTEKVMTKDPNLMKKALKYGVGYDKAAENQQHIDTVVSEIQDRIGALHDLGVEVDPTRVLGSEPVQGAVAQAAQHVAPTPGKNAVDRKLEDFYNSHGSVEVPTETPHTTSVPSGILDASGRPVMHDVTHIEHGVERVPRMIPAEEAKGIVSETYKQAKPAFDAPHDVQMEAKAVRSLAKGVMNELQTSEEGLVAAGKLPDAKLRGLGKEASERIRLQEVIEKAIRDETKRRGWAVSASGTAGAGIMAWGFGHPHVAAVVGTLGLTRILMQRKDVMSAYARALSKGERITNKFVTPASRVSNAVSSAANPIPPPPTSPEP